MARIGNTLRAIALKLALCVGLAGSMALMGGCHNTAAGALWGAWLGGVIGGDAESAAAGAVLGAGLGAVVDTHDQYCGSHSSGSHSSFYRYDY